MGKSVIFLTARWCGICKTLYPQIERVCRNAGVTLQKIDVDDYPNMVPPGVSSVPTMIVTGGIVLTGMTANAAALRKVLQE